MLYHLFASLLFDKHHRGPGFVRQLLSLLLPLKVKDFTVCDCLFENSALQKKAEQDLTIAKLNLKTHWRTYAMFSFIT